MEICNPKREKSSFYIKDIVDSIKKLLQSQLYAKNIEFINLIDESLEIHNYKNDLKQVLINIINNAKEAFIDSNEEKKTITVDSQKRSHKIVIYIEDSAGGVDDEIFEKIFDPYVSTKDSQKGSGLGLYISKKILEEQLGGEIVCKNTESGAVFEVVIPYINQRR
ncbi:MAG: sensor histidine kinase [Campylobacterales bacterium]